MRFFIHENSGFSRLNSQNIPAYTAFDMFSILFLEPQSTRALNAFDNLIKRDREYKLKCSAIVRNMEARLPARINSYGASLGS